MANTITLRGVSTEDALIAQAALETLGFKTVREFDSIEAYIVQMLVPEKYAHIIKEVEMIDGFEGTKKVLIKT